MNRDLSVALVARVGPPGEAAEVFLPGVGVRRRPVDAVAIAGVIYSGCRAAEPEGGRRDPTWLKRLRRFSEQNKRKREVDRAQ